MTTAPRPRPPWLASLAVDGELPPEERRASPYTGWTRAHWEWVADALLAGVRPYASPGHALIHIPGGRTSRAGRLSDGLEGYARTFLLAAFRLCGASGAAGGDLAERYASGLRAGTDPDSPESWPAIEPLSQPMVEAAAVAISLYETKPWIWDQLDDRTRTRTVDWLAAVHGKDYWPTNWLLFQVMVNMFLRSVGAPYRRQEIDGNLDRIDSMYRRDGWYTDGAGHNYDHYIGWAMHLYTILWCRMGGEEHDPARAAVYRQRLHRFLEDFRHLFGSNGAPLHQGRSLIYRFAALASVWAGALAGATPLAPGETRRIASGCLRHFLEHGAVRAGVLTMGWYDEFLPLAQSYSGPGSPYWASKGFLGLLLPAGDPVWTATEEPMAVERGDFVRVMPEPGFLAQGTRNDGIVRVASHRSDHFPFPLAPAADPSYRKLAYSTHAAPEIGNGGDEADTDGQIALLRLDGTHALRAHFHTIAVADCFAASAYYPGEETVIDGRSFPLWLERVETVSIAHQGTEIRIHHACAFGKRQLRDGGFAIAGARAPTVRTADTWSRATNEHGLTSSIAGLHGFDTAGVQERQAANAYGTFSATPFVQASAPLRGEGVYVSLVRLSGTSAGAESLLAEIASVEVDGRTVTVECSDGTLYFVQLVAADHVDRVIGGRRIRGPVRYARLPPAGEVFTWSA